jgi:hypothetical protein
LNSVQNIAHSSLRHSVRDTTLPISYRSGAYDGDVAAGLAYNTQRSYNSTSMDTLTTDFAHMGTRFLTQGSGDLASDILESHAYQPASPHRHHQHNSFPASGYNPPDLAPTRNPGAHQSASGRPMYSPVPGVGSDHAETHGTPEQSSPPLGVSQHLQSRYNTFLSNSVDSAESKGLQHSRRITRGVWTPSRLAYVIYIAHWPPSTI